MLYTQVPKSSTELCASIVTGRRLNNSHERSKTRGGALPSPLNIRYQDFRFATNGPDEMIFVFNVLAYVRTRSSGRFHDTTCRTEDSGYIILCRTILTAAILHRSSWTFWMIFSEGHVPKYNCILRCISVVCLPKTSRNNILRQRSKWCTRIVVICISCISWYR